MSDKLRQRLFWGGLAAELLLFLAWQGTHLSGFQWTTDEGLYVMRVRLLQQGYALYRDIWTDQLPGLVQIVQLAFAVGGPHVEAARAAVVVLAGIGLASAALVARRLSGEAGALLVVPLVAIVPNYYWLSRAVVSPDLPSTSLAVASLALVGAYTQHRQRGWLLASGLAMAAALYVKATGALVAVPCLVWLWCERSDVREFGHDVLVWSLAVGLPLVAALALQHPTAMWEQFVGTQATSAALELKLGAHAAKIGAYLRENWGLTAFGLSGLLVAALQRQRSLAIVGSWLVAALAILLVRSPMWPKHHLCILLYPLGIAAALAFGELVRAVRAQRASWTTGLSLLGLLAQLLALPGIVRADAALAAPQTYASTQAAVAFLRERYPEGTVVVSDYHMIPFEAGSSVPPALATVTKKRMQLGLLTTEALIQATEQSGAQVILLWDEQLASDEVFTSWARQRYGLAFKWGYHEILCLPPPGEALYEANVDLGSAVRLERYGIRHLATDPGGELELALYWRVLASPEQKLYGFVHVVNDAGDKIAQQDQLAFGLEHDSTAWRVGELIEDRYVISVPAEAPAGQYRFSVGLYDADTGRRLQARLADTGEALGGQVTLQPRPVVRWSSVTTPPAMDKTVSYRFEGVGELVGWSQGKDGDSLNVQLAWRAMASSTTDYVVFGHLRQGDELKAQHDAPPADGTRPTTGWREGEYILDERHIAIQGLSAGIYDLYVGLYDPATGQRVPVTAADGTAQPGDEVCLGQVVLAP